MVITSEQYSVNTVVEAQKIALDFRENIMNIMKDYSKDPLRQSELLYAALTQAQRAWNYVLENLITIIPRKTAQEYLSKILEGIKYLEKIDDRLTLGTVFSEEAVEDFAKDLFYL